MKLQSNCNCNRIHLYVIGNRSGNNGLTVILLTLKAPVTTKADNNFDFFFFFYFQMKTSLDISCEASAKQTIHMKYQDLFSLKNKK